MMEFERIDSILSVIETIAVDKDLDIEIHPSIKDDKLPYSAVIINNECDVK